MFAGLQEQFRKAMLEAKQRREELDQKDDILMARINGMAAELQMNGMAKEADDIMHRAVHIDIRHAQYMDVLQHKAGLRELLNVTRNTLSAFFKGKMVEERGFDDHLLVAASEERKRELSRFFEETYEKYRDHLPTRTVLEENLQYVMKSPEGQKAFQKIVSVRHKDSMSDTPTDLFCPGNFVRHIHRYSKSR